MENDTLILFHDGKRSPYILQPELLTGMFISNINSIFSAKSKVGAQLIALLQLTCIRYHLGGCEKRMVGIYKVFTNIL